MIAITPGPKPPYQTATAMAMSKSEKVYPPSRRAIPSAIATDIIASEDATTLPAGSLRIPRALVLDGPNTAPPQCCQRASLPRRSKQRQVFSRTESELLTGSGRHALHYCYVSQ